MSISSIHGDGGDGDRVDPAMENWMEICAIENRMISSLNKLPAKETMEQHIQARLTPRNTDKDAEGPDGFVHKLLGRKFEGAQIVYEQKTNYVSQTISEDTSSLRVTVENGITEVTCIVISPTGELESVYVNMSPTNVETGENSYIKFKYNASGEPPYQQLANAMERYLNILNSDAIASGAVKTVSAAS